MIQRKIFVNNNDNNNNILYFTVDKPAVPKHLVTVYEARSAMSEVVQDIISSSILTPNSTMEKINLNEVNEVMYQIERSMGQADLSRYKMRTIQSYRKTCLREILIL